ncbi:MAG: helix-turn-helix domain-containing protein [Gammaproteobacteria bacterium]
MSGRHTYRAIRAGVETLAPGIDLPRHRHTAGYATIVLAGSFIEASFAGRFMVEPGDVLLHGRFDCHANRALTRRHLRILRLPWLDDTLEGHFRTEDPDLLARAAEREPLEATAMLRRSLEMSPPRELHWPERLALALSHDPSLRLRTWSEREGIAPETLSRGFRRAFDVSPKLFRLEVRARLAWNALMRSDVPLTTIAHEYRFSDLAHMSRSVCAFTGFAPSRWRAAAGRSQLLRQLHSSEPGADMARCS